MATTAVTTAIEPVSRVEPTVYQMIAMDPPWPETGGGGRGAQNHYDVIKTREGILECIKDTGVFRPHDNCYLAMWVTNNYLPWGLWLMAQLGFSYKTMVTWPKKSHGTGYYFAGQTEHYLFGVRGTLMPKKKMSSSTLMKIEDDPSEYAGAHSRKPKEFFETIEAMCHRPRLEMFSRVPRRDWDVHGLDKNLPSQLGHGCVFRTTASGLTEVVRVA